MNPVSQSIYSTLTGGTALTSQLASTTAVYHAQAPQNAVLPYVVFSKAGGGPENIDPHNRRDLTYFVRGYALSDVTAGAIDSAIEALLHKQSITVTGWRTLWCVRETDLETVENQPNQVPVFMAGAMYRLRIT